MFLFHLIISVGSLNILLDINLERRKGGVGLWLLIKFRLSWRGVRGLDWVVLPPRTAGSPVRHEYNDIMQSTSHDTKFDVLERLALPPPLTRNTPHQPPSLSCPFHLPLLHLLHTKFNKNRTKLFSFPPIPPDPS
jgi:hypothetical protein